MRMIINTCSLAGGPLDARRVLFVRQPENRIAPESFFFRQGADGECYRYNLDGQNEQDGRLLFSYAGIDAEDADAEPFQERCAETKFPDDKKPAKKTRLFFSQGPFDGGYVFVLYPPELAFAGVDMALEWLGEDGEPVQSDRAHAYAPRPAWRFDEGLADDETTPGDVIPYEWAGAEMKAGAK